MQSGLVVVKPPSGNGKAGLLQRLKPVLVKTFVPERAIEALDVCVLSRSAWLNQDVLDAVLLCPRPEIIILIRNHPPTETRNKCKVRLLSWRICLRL